MLWQLNECHCSLRGQYNQRNEQLEAERELLRGGVRYQGVYKNVRTIFYYLLLLFTTFLAWNFTTF